MHGKFNETEKVESQGALSGCGGNCSCSGTAHVDHEHSFIPASVKSFYFKLAIFLYALGFLLDFLKYNALPIFTASTILAGLGVLERTFFQIKEGSYFTIDILMSIACIGALFLGDAQEATAVFFLFAIGEYFEGYAAGQARKGIEKLLERSPRVAILVENDTTKEIPVSECVTSNILEVRAGAQVPTDGIIKQGQSSFDESLLTGEAKPVFHQQGDTVVAGSICLDGLVRIEATSSFANSTLSRLVHMVEEASENKAPSTRFIEKFAQKYTPGVMIFALCVALLPLFGVEGGFTLWLYRGLSVLLIGCPCALVISIPASVTSAISSLSRRGVLIKGGAALEAVGKLKLLFFDKTGTITEGKFKVLEAISFAKEYSSADIASIAASLEQFSNHPLASAVMEYTKVRQLPVHKMEGIETRAGYGILGIFNGKTIGALSPRAAQALTSDYSHNSTEVSNAISAQENMGHTVVVIVEDKIAIGILAFGDIIRADAKEVTHTLTKNLGINCCIITGDNEKASAKVASELGIQAIAQCLPEEKTAHVASKAAEMAVGMVGDGINDAPALARAQVGIAMGGGTDVAMETADIVIPKNSLSGILDAVKTSRQTTSIIIQNVVIALALKFLFLVLTLTGHATLWMAVIADTGATLLVTVNALRLLQTPKAHLAPNRNHNIPSQPRNIEGEPAP